MNTNMKDDKAAALPKLTVKTKSSLTQLSLDELEQAIGGSAADGDSFGGRVDVALGRTSPPQLWCRSK